ncbi:prolyl aminopeptidase [Zhongshania aliphaticivorans]|uniref:prolyl aminopeptidase n=1 Tax=Zhongshania aliphaticivorans TaxID=1470434 RepID=UPI0012E59D16|nr:prolyl aminopeptidase [Zhongshania aliphaticivorans]CAA0112579.1 Proline iminopeptidase [Zhongshania aliphaticivorans]
MLTLYPDIKPYSTHRLSVQAPHILYVEESGNPDGIPVLFVHGGPGAGCSPRARCFFDPERYRIILFDQRGCGRSEPHACLDDNSTSALISDMEHIRQYLNIDKWVLFGGSWGSTLSLAYAQVYADRVQALILRGIFLCRPRELTWFYAEGGASRVFPDYWQDFNDCVTPRDGENRIQAYHRVLHGENEVARMSAAKAWSLWEARCSTLRPHHDVQDHLMDAHTAVAMSHIETHYFVNDAFMEENQLLNNMAAIENIPGIIVHGRYDMICPLESAVELHQHWPSSELHIIRDAGHSAFEASIADALVKASDDIADLLTDGELSY